MKPLCEKNAHRAVFCVDIGVAVLTRAAQRANRKPGFKEGRPKKYSRKQIAHALELLETSSYTEVERMTGISKSTLTREAFAKKGDSGYYRREMNLIIHLQCRRRHQTTAKCLCWQKFHRLPEDRQNTWLLEKCGRLNHGQSIWLLSLSWPRFASHPAMSTQNPCVCKVSAPCGKSSTEPLFGKSEKKVVSQACRSSSSSGDVGNDEILREIVEELIDA